MLTKEFSEKCIKVFNDIDREFDDMTGVYQAFRNKNPRPGSYRPPYIHTYRKIVECIGEENISALSIKCFDDEDYKMVPEFILFGDGEPWRNNYSGVMTAFVEFLHNYCEHRYVIDEHNLKSPKWQWLFAQWIEDDDLSDDDIKKEVKDLCYAITEASSDLIKCIQNKTCFYKIHGEVSNEEVQHLVHCIKNLTNWVVNSLASLGEFSVLHVINSNKKNLLEEQLQNLKNQRNAIDEKIAKLEKEISDLG